MSDKVTHSSSVGDKAVNNPSTVNTRDELVDMLLFAFQIPGSKRGRVAEWLDGEIGGLKPVFYKEIILKLLNRFEQCFLEQLNV